MRIGADGRNDRTGVRERVDAVRPRSCYIRMRHAWLLETKQERVGDLARPGRGVFCDFVKLGNLCPWRSFAIGRASA